MQRILAVPALCLALVACRSAEDPAPPAPTDTTTADTPTLTDSGTSVPTGTTPTADTASPTDTGPAPSLTSLDVGVPLNPPFDPDTRYYWVRASDVGGLDDLSLTVSDGASLDVSLETPDGEGMSMSGPLDDLRLKVTVSRGGRRVAYSVALLSDTFPVPEATGTASEGWTFVTVTYKEPLAFDRAVMAVDSNGTPGWWRSQRKAAYDFRIAADGRFTWIGRDTPAAPTLQNLRIDDDGSFDLVLETGPVDPTWIDPKVDEHEFEVLADGTSLRLLNYRVMEDLSPWGGPAEQRVEHQVAQHVDAQGNVLFEFSTEGLVPYDELPAPLLANMVDEDWEPFHINSIDIDPADGHWVMSLQRISTVFKVARTGPQQGEVLWLLGGLSSDFRFVNDERDDGWMGFAGQHSARVTGPDRIELFDNANASNSATGDVRVVEYQLDTTKMEATLVWEHEWTGRGRAYAAGSVQSLADGHHLVGFGSLIEDVDGARVPTLTELDGDGQEIWHLTLPDGHWSYRGWRFQGDPMRGGWVP